MKPPPHILLLVEGGSEERFMRTFLPHLGFKADVDFFLRSYGGRAHWKSRTRKDLRGWKTPEVRKFIIQQDQEELSNDCKKVKQDILNWVKEQCPKQSKRLLVRITCRELEAWYLGNPDALWEAFPEASGPVRKRVLSKCKNTPDGTREKPSEILRGVAGRDAQFPKKNAARDMGDILGRKCAEDTGEGFGGNLSPSFRCFVRTMREELKKLREGPGGDRV